MDKEFAIRLNKLKTPLYSQAMKWYKGNTHKSDDLVSEAIKRAYDKRNKYNEEGRLFSWVMTIMKNLFVNEYRKYTLRRTELTNDLSIINFPSNENPEAKQTLDRVMVYLKSHRYGYLLIEWIEGWSYEELSSKYEIPLGTVKNKIYQARQATISEFKQEYYAA